MPIVAKTFPNTWVALGLAAHFVARHEPFGGFASRDLVKTLSRQIEGGHYLLALDTASEPARVVGFFGWSLYSTEAAERFARTGRPPGQELQGGGDVIWILTAAASSQAAFRAMIRAARKDYPDHRVMAVRHKAGRPVLFDQSRQRVASRKGAVSQG